MYFKLNSYAYIVPSNSKGCIYDLKSGKVYTVSKELCDQIISLEQNTQIEETGVDRTELDKLVKLELGDYYEHNICVDKIRYGCSRNMKNMMFQKNRIYSLFLQIENICNMDCSFCDEVSYNRVTGCRKYSDKKLVSIDQYKKILFDAKKLGCISLSLLGGEPLLQKELVKEILKYAEYLEYKEIYLYTNAFLLDEKFIVENKNRFNNVSFSYGNKNVIKNFSYDIRRGDKILITGKNGVGKSTIIKLMLGFYDNYEGEIIINEKNLHHINLNNLRNNVAIVSQPCYFFYGSVMENIIYDGNKRKKEFLFYLQKKYHLHNYFQSLNHGYHTIIKNDISNLSAGQKQLIGFCRALCSQKNFMILDEATANMEKGLKYKILEMLFNETKNRTCLVISHDQELNEILKNRGFKELTIK